MYGTTITAYGWVGLGWYVQFLIRVGTEEKTFLMWCCGTLLIYGPCVGENKSIGIFFMRKDGRLDRALVRGEMMGVKVNATEVGNIFEVAGQADGSVIGGVETA